MATKPITEGRASPLSNVVRLPTAARRQPQNNRYAAQRANSTALKEETAGRFDYQFPSVRAAMRAAETFRKTTPTPALLIVTAMFKALPEESQQEVMRVFDAQGSRGEAHEQAELVMELCRPMTYGAADDFARGLNLVERRRVCRSDQAEGE